MLREGSEVSRLRGAAPDEEVQVSHVLVVAHRRRQLRAASTTFSVVKEKLVREVIVHTFHWHRGPFLAFARRVPIRNAELFANATLLPPL